MAQSVVVREKTEDSLRKEVANRTKHAGHIGRRVVGVQYQEILDAEGNHVAILTIEGGSVAE